MTCIVGIEDQRGTVVAGDAAHLSGWRKTNSAAPKVFRLGPLVVGGAGGTRVAQIVQYRLEVPADPQPTMAWMVGSLIPALRAVLRAEGALETDKGIDEIEGCSAMLVGIGGSLFTVWSDMQVESAARGYQAVGAGAEVAVGALHVTASARAGPGKRARLALEAAAEHSASVAPPFTVVRARPLGER